MTANDDELRNAIDDWKRNLEMQVEQINEMFDLHIKVRFPYYREMQKGVSNGGTEFL